MRALRTLVLSAAAVAVLAGTANASQSGPLEQVAVTPRVNSAADPALAPMALNSLSNPPAEIATARVVDDKGATIGAVQKVDIDGGKPSKVQIVLLGTRQIIALDAGQLSYDKSNNVLTASLDKSHIVQMPAAPQG